MPQNFSDALLSVEYARPIEVDVVCHRSCSFNKVKRKNHPTTVAQVVLAVVGTQRYAAFAVEFDVDLPSGATNDVLVRCLGLGSKNEGFVAKRVADGPV